MHLLARCLRGLLGEVGALGQTALRQLTGSATRSSTSEYTHMHRIYCPEHGWVYHRVYPSQLK